MTFKEALEQTPTVNNAWRKGLKALRPEDRVHVEAEDPRQLRGSADIDAALLRNEPNANRWDFGISYQHEDRKDEVIYWTEMHTASDKEVKVVMKKAQWLINWLLTKAPKLNAFERDIVWVASGATSMTLSNPQRKQMAQVGLQLQFVGSKLRLKNKRD